MLTHHPDYVPNPNCGCGADNARFDFVPDNILGVDIRKCCCIHDHRYLIGGTQRDKEEADLELFCNIIRCINAEESDIYPTLLAHKFALDYYEAVYRLGNSSFNWRTNND